MYYVIPAVIGIENNSVENEVKLITNYELMKGNKVENIIPFYYPICIVSINYSYSYLLDPNSTRVIKYTYRVPDTLFMSKLIDNVINNYRNPIKIFRETYSIVNKYSNVRNWLEYGVIISKVLYGKRIIDRFNKLMNYCIVDELNGLVYKPIDVDVVTENNTGLFSKIISDLNNVILDIDYLRNKIIETRYRYEYLLNRVFDKKMNVFKRVYKSVSRDKPIVLDETSIENLVIEYPLLDISKDYETLIEKRKYSKHVRKLLENTLLKMFNSIKKSRFRVLKSVSTRFENRDLLIEDIETTRRKYLFGEMRNICREYVGYLNIINLYTERILDRLNTVMRKIDSYRRELMHLLIHNSPLSNQCIYLRGYVIIGSKVNRVYTTCYFTNELKYRFTCDEAIKSILEENKIIEHLLKINQFTHSTGSVFK